MGRFRYILEALKGEDTMRDIIFREIREKNIETKAITDEVQKEAGQKLLIDTVEQMLKLSEVAHKEGLLALEEAINKLDEIPDWKYLCRLMILVVDGIEPTVVEEIGMARYFAMGLSDYYSLQLLLELVGVLAIQAGDNPYILENKMIALFPEEVYEFYRKKQKEIEKKKKEENALDLPESFFEGDIAVKPDDEHYFSMKIVDYAIGSLDDMSMQKLLRNIDNGDLIVAMIGFSGNTRRRIFDNFSKALASMIAEDIRLMGPVRMKAVAEAMQKMFSVLIRLIASGEVWEEKEDVLELVKKVFV